MGCGGCRLSLHIDKSRYYGIDINKYLIKNYSKNGLKVKYGRADKIPFPSNFFNCVWCSHVLEHLDSNSQFEAFKEFYRVLKKGGKLIVFSPTPFDLRFWDSPDHTRPLTHNSLMRLAESNNFKNINVFYSKVRFLPKNSVLLENSTIFFR